MEKSPYRKNNFRARFLTAIILGPLAVAMILGGYVYSLILITVITTGALYEWFSLARSQKIWLFGGIIYITFAMVGLSFYLLSDQSFLLAILLTTWISDISSYLIGSRLQGPRLAPTISPGKTWSGSIGGFIISVPLCMVLFSYVFSHKIALYQVSLTLQSHFNITMAYLTSNLILMFILSGFLIIVAQAGDLFESWAKRHFRVKDSGHILPGHGGLLDRIDSLIAIGFVLFFYNLMS